VHIVGFIIRVKRESYVYSTVHHCDSWRIKDQLAILFHFLCAQHVSDINISITRSLLLFCSITTLVVVLLFRTKNNTTNVVIQQNSRKLLMIDILMSETYWAHKKWNKIASDIRLVFYFSIKKELCVSIYRAIQNDCRGFNNLPYTIHLR